jgi:long-chain acyl-CoA synthetase
LPTNHAIDFMCGFIVPLLFGATVVHQRTLRPQFLASTMKRYRITHMALVPMLLKALEKKLRERIEGLVPWQRTLVDGLIHVNERATARTPNHRLSSTLLKPIHDAFGGRLKLLFCGGAFVDPDSASFFYRLGIPVVIGYGLTEAGTVVTVNDLKPFRADTVGVPVPGTEIELRNQNESGIGEVWIRGGTVMKGYLHEPELTEEVLVDGWLATGDLGSLDAANHLTLVGRARNMIVTEGGKNIYPEDIESAFNDIDGAEEHCVFATNFIWPKKGLTGEELTLVVRPASGADPDAILREMTKRNRRLVDFKRVSTFLLWNEEFARTASMKIKRNILAEALGETENRGALRKVA